MREDESPKEEKVETTRTSNMQVCGCLIHDADNGERHGDGGRAGDHHSAHSRRVVQLGLGNLRPRQVGCG